MEHLIFVVLVVGALAVAGYMHRDKLRGLFARRERLSEAVFDPVVAPVSGSSPVNPFVSWKARGFSLVDIVMWGNERGAMQGKWLTEQEVSLAAQAGYDVSTFVPVVGGQVDRTGSDLNNGFVRVNKVGEGQSLTYTFTVPGDLMFVRFSTFTHSGSSFRRLEFSVSGPKSFRAVTEAGGSSAIADLFQQNLPAGDYAVTVTYRDVQAGENGVAAQCHINPSRLAHVSDTTY